MTIIKEVILEKYSNSSKMILGVKNTNIHCSCRITITSKLLRDNLLPITRVILIAILFFLFVLIAVACITFHKLMKIDKKKLNEIKV